jgi:Tol biopolymer transport system component
MKTVIAIMIACGVASADAPPVPQLFAPGVISSPANDGSPTFTPDGNTLLFTRSTAAWSAILESHRTGDVWSEPQLAAFSGEWPDSSPAIAPDGTYAVFVRIQAHAAQLYRVDRAANGTWSTPAKLPATVNIGDAIWKPSVAADGTIYFVSIDKAGHKRLYSAAKAKTGYAQAQPLPFSDGTKLDVDPEIAPDGSFLVFCSAGRIAGNQKDQLFIARKTKTGWSEPAAIHYAGDGSSTDDEPHLGADRRTLYFSSDRAGAVAFPRTHEQAVRDVQRLEQWDNSNSNVWTIPLAG